MRFYKWVRQARKPKGQKQMGPALLPTPLSPARGRFVSGIGSGEPSLLPSSLRAWLPVFHSRPAASCLVHPFGFSSLLAALLRGFSPVLAPASDLRCCIARCPFGPAPAFQPTPFLGFSPPLGESRDRYSGLVSQTLMRFCPRAVVSQLSPAILSALNDCLASRLSQTIELAFGRGLLHAFSQELRGQQQPCLCFAKTSLNSVPCGSVFEGFLVPKTD